MLCTPALASGSSPTGQISQWDLPTPNSYPLAITAGPDGNLWFTEPDGNAIGRIDPTTGAITNWPLTTGSYPAGIAAGPDGNLWFTENGRDRIGRIDPTTGAITDWALPAGSTYPYAIAAGPDGNLWFTEQLGNSVGRIGSGMRFGTLPPAVTGSGRAGDPQRCDTGSWALQASPLSYLWTRNGTPIPGAIGTTYTPTGDDVGTALACTVTVAIPAVLTPTTLASSAPSTMRSSDAGLRVGPDGPAGPAGTAGTAGTTGPTGSTGTTGDAGLTGTSGPAGPRALLIAARRAHITARTGTTIRVPYSLTANASVTLTLRNNRGRTATLHRTSARTGRRSMTVRLTGVRPGRYTLILTATTTSTALAARTATTSSASLATGTAITGATRRTTARATGTVRSQAKVARTVTAPRTPAFTG